MISHEHRSIFVHIPKNAGQSIESVFLKLANLTWETRGPLLMRNNDDPKLGPPNLDHLTAREYVDCGHISESLFQSYFKFAVVRNPWDRAVSIYKYIGLRKGYEFKKFVSDKLRNDLLVNWRWFNGPQSQFLCNDQGELIVDFLIRYENLEQDFLQVCRRLSLPVDRLPRVNKSKNLKLDPKGLWKRLRISLGVDNPVFHDSYQSYYDDESKALVAELYAEDVALLGYRFEPGLPRIQPEQQCLPR